MKYIKQHSYSLAVLGTLIIVSLFGFALIQPGGRQRKAVSEESHLHWVSSTIQTKDSPVPDVLLGSLPWDNLIDVSRGPKQHVILSLGKSQYLAQEPGLSIKMRFFGDYDLCKRHLNLLLQKQGFHAVTLAETDDHHGTKYDKGDLVVVISRSNYLDPDQKSYDPSGRWYPRLSDTAYGERQKSETKKWLKRLDVEYYSTRIVDDRDQDALNGENLDFFLVEIYKRKYLRV